MRCTIYKLLCSSKNNWDSKEIPDHKDSKYFFMISIVGITLINLLLVIFIATIIRLNTLEFLIVLILSSLLSIMYVCLITFIKYCILDNLNLKVKDITSKDGYNKVNSNNLCSKSSAKCKKDKIKSDLVYPLKYAPWIETIKSYLSLLVVSLSADYLITYQIKDGLKRREINYSLLIKEFNIKNLILSIILVIAAAIILLFKTEDIILTSIIYVVIMVRAFSRGIEVMIAFLKDIIKNKPKNTELNSGERIKLAIISLVEITILFTIVYLPFTKGAIKLESILNSFIYSLGVSTLADVNLTFEVVNNNLVSFPLAKSFVAGFHLIISLSLIVLSIAQYIGNVQPKT